MNTFLVFSLEMVFDNNRDYPGAELILPYCTQNASPYPMGLISTAFWRNPGCGQKSNPQNTFVSVHLKNPSFSPGLFFSNLQKTFGMFNDLFASLQPCEHEGNYDSGEKKI